MKRILVTGGAGFMGSQLVRSLQAVGWEVVVLDKLTYAGRRAFLEGVEHQLIVGDVCDQAAVTAAIDGVDAVVHMAAESHVARSLTDPDAFLRTNVLGTRVVLDAACRAGIERFLHVSTDEVFGSAPDGMSFGPGGAMCPGNAYAASKVAGEALVHAWRHTHGFGAAIVRCTNNYGPRQHIEKAIPCWIMAGLAGTALPVHGQGLAVRDWLHVEDFSRGVLKGLERFRPDACWHFAGQAHVQNKEMATRVAAALGAPGLSFGPERQGQDARYDLDDRSTREELDWAPRIRLDQGLSQTIAWYRDHGSLWD